MLAWPAVDPQQALADLTEISSQVRAAVLLDAQGALVAATVADDTRARHGNEVEKSNE